MRRFSIRHGLPQVVILFTAGGRNYGQTLAFVAILSQHSFTTAYIYDGTSSPFDNPSISNFHHKPQIHLLHLDNQLTLKSHRKYICQILTVHHANISPINTTLSFRKSIPRYRGSEAITGFAKMYKQLNCNGYHLKDTRITVKLKVQIIFPGFPVGNPVSNFGFPPPFLGVSETQ